VYFWHTFPLAALVGTLGKEIFEYSFPPQLIPPEKPWGNLNYLISFENMKGTTQIQTRINSPCKPRGIELIGCGFELISPN
jgi:hypothetical protein